jgi:hypothetical protein
MVLQTYIIRPLKIALNFWILIIIIFIIYFFLKYHNIYDLLDSGEGIFDPYQEAGYKHGMTQKNIPTIIRTIENPFVIITDAGKWYIDPQTQLFVMTIGTSKTEIPLKDVGRIIPLIRLSKF